MVTFWEGHFLPVAHLVSKVLVAFASASATAAASSSPPDCSVAEVSPPLAAVVVRAGVDASASSQTFGGQKGYFIYELPRYFLKLVQYPRHRI